MTGAEVLAGVTGVGARVSVVDGRLRVDAAPGALTADLRAELTAHKMELIGLLASPRARRMVRYERADDAGPVVWRLVRVLDGSRLPDREAGLFVGRDWARAWAIAHRYEVVEVEAPEPPPREPREGTPGSAPCDLAQSDSQPQSEDR